MNFDLADLAFDESQQLNAQGFFPRHPVKMVALGYDPAQSFDESALVMVESVREPIPVLANDPENNIKALDANMRQKLGPQMLYVRKIRRLPKGMTYPDQCGQVKIMVDNAARIGKRAEVAIDVTGVGKPIAQMMPAFGMQPTQILITGGNEVTQSSGVWHVPKKILVGLLDSHLNNKELVLPALSPSGNTQDDVEIKELRKQMANFVAGYTASGSATYAASGSGKDDVVLALSYCTFLLSNRRGRHHWSAVDLSTIIG